MESRVVVREISNKDISEMQQVCSKCSKTHERERDFSCVTYERRFFNVDDGSSYYACFYSHRE